jgi:hypothetical protein
VEFWVINRYNATGSIEGVLIDFDLASHCDFYGNAIETSPKERTRTTPFLATDLLTEMPPVHCYRHDLESFLYALVWICTRYHEGRLVNTRELDCGVMGHGMT